MTGEFSGSFSEDVAMAAETLAAQQLAFNQAEQLRVLAAQQDLGRLAAVPYRPTYEDLQREQRSAAIGRLYDVSQEAAHVLLRSHASYDFSVSPPQRTGRRNRTNLWAIQEEKVAIFYPGGGEPSRSGQFNESSSSIVTSATGIDRNGNFYTFKGSSGPDRKGTRRVFDTFIQPAKIESLVGVQGELYESSYRDIVNMVARARLR
jgi:hypothetical protein